AYMDGADRVIMMDAYRPEDATERARSLAAESTGRVAEADSFALPRPRVVDPGSVSSEAKGRTKIRAGGTDSLRFGNADVDVRSIEQITDQSMTLGIGLVADVDVRSIEQITDQSMTLGIGLALEAAVRRGWIDGRATVAEALDRLEAALETEGVAGLLRIREADLALPRRHEVAATLNRMRELRVRQTGGS